jgi:hypothetical protein
MSQVVSPPPLVDVPRKEPRQAERARGAASRWRGRAAVSLLILLGFSVAGYWALRGYRQFVHPANAEVPIARVERGDVTLSITAKGELQGGNPEVLAAPMTAGGNLHITFLRKPGEQVKTGDTVVQFDTTEQEYKLKEAESDLAEADQKIIDATAKHEAEEEEDRYSLVKAQNDLKSAELEARKNPLLAAITAKQNDLAVQNAREHLSQVQQNIANRAATGGAGIQIEQAGRAKAESQAITARENIQAMTLRAHHDGYVSVKQAVPTSGFFFGGMVLPLYQIGDAVNPGVAIAEIPDLGSWQIAANIGELDRGHINVGNPVEATVIAVPQKRFHGFIKELGGTTGPFWDRHFETKIALSDPAPALRPGMSTTLVITTQTMRGVLSIPAQALSTEGGKSTVFLRSGGAFKPQEVKLVQKNETRAVVEGLREGGQVALSNPLEAAKSSAHDSGPLSTVGK